MRGRTQKFHRGTAQNKVNSRDARDSRGPPLNYGPIDRNASRKASGSYRLLLQFDGILRFIDERLIIMPLGSHKRGRRSQAGMTWHGYRLLGGCARLR
jgi:hypothetical protein